MGSKTLLWLCPQATAPFLHIGALHACPLAWPVADTFYHIHRRGANSTTTLQSLNAHQCFCLLLLHLPHLCCFCPRAHHCTFFIACPHSPQVPRSCYCSYILEPPWKSISMNPIHLSACIMEPKTYHTSLS